jgi:hypothetical protein
VGAAGIKAGAVDPPNATRPAIVGPSATVVQNEAAPDAGVLILTVGMLVLALAVLVIRYPSFLYSSERGEDSIEDPWGRRAAPRRRRQFPVNREKKGIFAESGVFCEAASRKHP